MIFAPCFWELVLNTNILLIIIFYFFLFFCVMAAKALEQFLQDLCNRTYEITLMKGAKTVNAFHL
jgi:hypothetical protein